MLWKNQRHFIFNPNNSTWIANMSTVSERLYKKLQTAGLSLDACEKYVQVLRSFLAARITRKKFEQDLNNILSPEKRPVHNAIILELLSRAIKKREGVADLPALPPLKDKRDVANLKRDRSIPKSPHPKSEPVLPLPQTPQKPLPSLTLQVKRQPDPINADLRRPESPSALDAPIPPTKRLKPRPIGKAKASNDSSIIPVTPTLPEVPTAQPVKSKSKPTKQNSIIERSPVDKSFASREEGQKVTVPSNNLPPPSPTVLPPTPGAIPHAPPKVHSVTPPELETYDNLDFMPTRPGTAMDIDLFTKLKPRVRQLVEMEGLVGVKDDGVALLSHAAEIQVKRLLQSAVFSRRSRSGNRPVGTYSCAPIRSFDLRQSALENLDLLVDESAVSLERLSMLI